MKKYNFESLSKAVAARRFYLTYISLEVYDILVQASISIILVDGSMDMCIWKKQ